MSAEQDQSAHAGTMRLIGRLLLICVPLVAIALPWIVAPERAHQWLENQYHNRPRGGTPDPLGMAIVRLGSDDPDDVRKGLHDMEGMLKTEPRVPLDTGRMPEALDLAVGLLDHSDPVVQAQAARLAQLLPLKQLAPHLPKLIAALDSENTEVQVTSTRLLGSLGPQAIAAVPELQQQLEKPGYDVAISAADALRTVDAQALLECLGRHAAQLEQADHEHWVATARVLGAYGPVALPPDAAEVELEMQRQMFARPSSGTRYPHPDASRSLDYLATTPRGIALHPYSRRTLDELILGLDGPEPVAEEAVMHLTAYASYSDEFRPRVEKLALGPGSAGEAARGLLATLDEIDAEEYSGEGPRLDILGAQLSLPRMSRGPQMKRELRPLSAAELNTARAVMRGEVPVAARDWLKRQMRVNQSEQLREAAQVAVTYALLTRRVEDGELLQLLHSRLLIATEKEFRLQVNCAGVLALNTRDPVALIDTATSLMSRGRYTSYQNFGFAFWLTVLGERLPQHAGRISAAVRLCDLGEDLEGLVAGSLEQDDAAAAALLAPALKSLHDMIFPAACWQLAQRRQVPDEVIEQLQREVDGDMLYRRQYALLTLAEIRPDALVDHVPLLMQWVGNGDAWSAPAAYLLGRAGPAAAEAVPLLRNAQYSFYPELRLAAAVALRRIEGS